MLNFVNHLGQPISHLAIQKKKLAAAQDARREQSAKRATAAAEEFHKGWRVTGVRASDLQKAREAAAQEAKEARAQGRVPKEWNEENWLMNAKGKPIRAKPYEVKDAAMQCKALAEKSPEWLRVRIEELKREKQ